MANTKRIFRVKAVQQDANNEVKKHYNDVGTIVMHDSGETGTLFLNHLPGMSYALFLKKKSQVFVRSVSHPPRSLQRDPS